MNLPLLIAIVFACSIPHAFTQAQDQTKRSFDGLGVGLNAVGPNSNSRRTSSSNSESRDTGSADLQLQYAWTFDSPFVLGIGGTMGTNTLDAEAINGINASTKDRIAFDFMPGFTVSDSLLIYAKASYLTATAVINNPAGSPTETTQAITGKGYGIGVRALITRNVYWHLAYARHQYNAFQASPLTTLEPSARIFSLGIGYRF